MSRLLKAAAGRVGSAAKTSLAVVGFATTVAGVSTIWQTRRFIAEESKEKKRVLVLPFHSLRLVEKSDRFSWMESRGSDSVQEIEVQDFVDTLHEAASDLSIMAIYGEFGGGRSLSAGAADLEEIRNALRVFRESHRKHSEPNLSYDPVLQRQSNSSPRPLYCYTVSILSCHFPCPQIQVELPIPRICLLTHTYFCRHRIHLKAWIGQTILTILLLASLLMSTFKDKEISICSATAPPSHS